jgi:hypothetical protein
MKDGDIRQHKSRTKMRKEKANGLLSKVQQSVPKIEIWNGKRKNNRWEEELSEGALRAKTARRAHQGQNCTHCNTWIEWKATKLQPWNGPPGAHKDCTRCIEVHTKMEHHLIHHCGVYKDRPNRSHREETQKKTS